jgi:hypothetical protein
VGSPTDSSFDDWANLYSPPTQVEDRVELGGSAKGGAADPVPEVAISAPVVPTPPPAAPLLGVALPEDEGEGEAAPAAGPSPSRAATRPAAPAAPVDEVAAADQEPPAARDETRTPTALDSTRAGSRPPVASAPPPGRGAVAAATSMRAATPPVLPPRRRPVLPPREQQPSPAAAPAAAPVEARSPRVSEEESRRPTQPPVAVAIRSSSSPEVAARSAAEFAALGPLDPPPPRPAAPGLDPARRTGGYGFSRRSTTASQRKVRPAVPLPDAEGTVHLLLDNVLTSKVPAEELAKLDLSPAEAYLLLQLDGHRSIGEVYSLMSHLDPHDVRDGLTKLLGAELVAPA